MDKVTRDNVIAVVKALEAHFGRYLVLPDPNYSLVLSLWAIMSWCFPRFYSIPYVAFGGKKGSGKSTALNLLRDVCVKPHKVSGSTAPALFRKLDAYGGVMTLLIDEAEATGREVKDLMSQFLNDGYKRGGVIDRVVGGQVVSYPAFCPKAFAAIGDVNDALRTRCIPIRMERGQPAADYWPETAEGEGKALVARIEWALNTLHEHGVVIAADYPSFLDTRDREIWGAIFGLARAFGLHKSDVDRLVMVASDSAALKTAAKVSTRQEDDSEDDWQDRQYGRRLLRDLVRVFDAEGGQALFTVQAVEKLRALPDGPWRKFKGPGLDAVVFAELVARFDLKPKTVRIGKGRSAPTSKGYKADEVREALKRAEDGQ